MCLCSLRQLRTCKLGLGAKYSMLRSFDTGSPVSWRYTSLRKRLSCARMTPQEALDVLIEVVDSSFDDYYYHDGVVQHCVSVVKGNACLLRSDACLALMHSISFPALSDVTDRSMRLPDVDVCDSSVSADVSSGGARGSITGGLSDSSLFSRDTTACPPLRSERAISTIRTLLSPLSLTLVQNLMSWLHGVVTVCQSGRGCQSRRVVTTSAATATHVDTRTKSDVCSDTAVCCAAHAAHNHCVNPPYVCPLWSTCPTRVLRGCAALLAFMSHISVAEQVSTVMISCIQHIVQPAVGALGLLTVSTTTSTLCSAIREMDHNRDEEESSEASLDRWIHVLNACIELRLRAAPALDTTAQACLSSLYTVSLHACLRFVQRKHKQLTASQGELSLKQIRQAYCHSIAIAACVERSCTCTQLIHSRSCALRHDSELLASEHVQPEDGSRWKGTTTTTAQHAPTSLPNVQDQAIPQEVHCSMSMHDLHTRMQLAQHAVSLAQFVCRGHDTSSVHIGHRNDRCHLLSSNAVTTLLGRMSCMLFHMISQWGMRVTCTEGTGMPAAGHPVAESGAFVTTSLPSHARTCSVVGSSDETSTANTLSLLVHFVRVFRPYLKCAITSEDDGDGTAWMHLCAVMDVLHRSRYAHSTKVNTWIDDAMYVLLSTGLQYMCIGNTNNKKTSNAAGRAALCCHRASRDSLVRIDPQDKVQRRSREHASTLSSSHFDFPECVLSNADAAAPAAAMSVPFLMVLTRIWYTWSPYMLASVAQLHDRLPIFTYTAAGDAADGLRSSPGCACDEQAETGQKLGLSKDIWCSLPDAYPNQAQPLHNSCCSSHVVTNCVVIQTAHTSEPHDRDERVGARRVPAHVATSLLLAWDRCCSCSRAGDWSSIDVPPLLTLLTAMDELIILLSSPVTDTVDHALCWSSHLIEACGVRSNGRHALAAALSRKDSCASVGRKTLHCIFNHVTRLVVHSLQKHVVIGGSPTPHGQMDLAAALHMCARYTSECTAFDMVQVGAQPSKLCSGVDETSEFTIGKPAACAATRLSTRARRVDTVPYTYHCSLCEIGLGHGSLWCSTLNALLEMDVEATGMNCLTDALLRNTMDCARGMGVHARYVLDAASRLPFARQCPPSDSDTCTETVGNDCLGNDSNRHSDVPGKSASCPCADTPLCVQDAQEKNMRATNRSTTAIGAETGPDAIHSVTSHEHGMLPLLSVCGVGVPYDCTLITSAFVWHAAELCWPRLGDLLPRDPAVRPFVCDSKCRPTRKTSSAACHAFTTLIRLSSETVYNARRSCLAASDATPYNSIHCTLHAHAVDRLVFILGAHQSPPWRTMSHAVLRNGNSHLSCSSPECVDSRESYRGYKANPVYREQSPHMYMRCDESSLCVANVCHNALAMHPHILPVASKTRTKLWSLHGYWQCVRSLYTATEHAVADMHNQRAPIKDITAQHTTNHVRRLPSSCRPVRTCYAQLRQEVVRRCTAHAGRSRHARLANVADMLTKWCASMVCNHFVFYDQVGLQDAWDVHTFGHRLAQPTTSCRHGFTASQAYVMLYMLMRCEPVLCFSLVSVDFLLSLWLTVFAQLYDDIQRRASKYNIHSIAERLDELLVWLIAIQLAGCLEAIQRAACQWMCAWPTHADDGVGASFHVELEAEYVVRCETMKSKMHKGQDRVTRVSDLFGTTKTVSDMSAKIKESTAVTYSTSCSRDIPCASLHCPHLVDVYEIIGKSSDAEEAIRRLTCLARSRLPCVSVDGASRTRLTVHDLLARLSHDVATQLHV